MIVIAMPVGIEQIADRLARPLANLRDVSAGAGWQIAGIHDQYAGVADDDHRIPLRKMIGGILVLDEINALGELRYRALIAAGGICEQEQRDDQPDRQKRCAERNHGRAESSVN